MRDPGADRRCNFRTERRAGCALSVCSLVSLVICQEYVSNDGSRVIMK